MQKSMQVSNEMEEIDNDYSPAYEAADDYLQSQQDDRSSVTSETLTTKMLEKMDISEISRKEIAETQESLKQTEQEIRTARSNTNYPANLPIRENLQANQTTGSHENQLMKRNVRATKNGRQLLPLRTVKQR